MRDLESVLLIICMFVFIIACSACTKKEECMHLHKAGPDGMEMVTYCGRYVHCVSSTDETGTLTSCTISQDEVSGK